MAEWLVYGGEKRGEELTTTPLPSNRNVQCSILVSLAPWA